MNQNQENPYLSGNYEPVLDQLNLHDLQVIGEIPKDLSGIYMRNGPNPEFPPISYTYPYDGDGMIHALYLKNGTASYRNRFVETKPLLKERKAGKALYGGLLHLIPMDPQWAGPEDQPLAVKNGAFIHIIRHADTYLALNEGAPAYKMTADLQTQGEWTPYGEKPIDICAHTRFDPLTGELWCINYSLIPPYLSLYRFDKQGVLKNKWDIDKEYSSMFHDFVLTQNYVILFDSPAIFDLNQLMKGGPLLEWRAELNTRIGIMPRTGGIIEWIHTDPFFVFHFANAYEQDNQIIIDYVRHQKLVMLMGDTNKLPATLYRTTINLLNKTMQHTALDGHMTEFPRIREDKNTMENRFIYSLSRTGTCQNQRVMNVLLKYDTLNKTSEVCDFGNHAELSEAVFAPIEGKSGEDDGYLMLFVYNSTNKQSEFLILNARHINDEPLARIQLPRRVPHGLHGSWMPGEW